MGNANIAEERPTRRTRARDSDLSSPIISTHDHTNPSSLQKLPPLKVTRSSHSQTNNETPTKTADTITLPKTGWNHHSHWISYLSIGLAISYTLYWVLIIALVYSKTLQSIIVYLHLLRRPPGDLTHLQSFAFSLPHTRNINFTTSDGLLLRGWHLIPPQGDPDLYDHTNSEDFFDRKLSEAPRTIIYFHGNGGTRGLHNRVDQVKHLSTYFRAHVVSFDYRGFGDSEGWPSEEGTHLDAVAVVHGVSRRMQRFGGLNETVGKSRGKRSAPSKKTCLFFYGHSLGSGVSTALTLALEDKNQFNYTWDFCGLILDAPYTSLPAATLTHPSAAPFRIFPFVKQLMMDSIMFEYQTIKRVPLLKTPLLLLHGEKDFKLPSYHSRLLFQAATGIELPLNGSLAQHDLSFIPDRQGSLVPYFKSFGVLAESNSGIPVEIFEFEEADHNTIFVMDSWFLVVSSFIKKAESYRDSIKPLKL